MMKIIIEEFKIIMNIGVREDERAHPQEIIINLECEFDFSKAIKTDTIQNTINYKDIIQVIIQYCQNHSPKLLEKLAGDLIQEIHHHFPQIISIKIQVFKPNAIHKAKRTGIEIFSQFSSSKNDKFHSSRL